MNPKSLHPDTNAAGRDRHSEDFRQEVREEDPPAVAVRRPVGIWKRLVQTLGLVLFALGIVILLHPGFAALLFAIPATGTTDRFLLRAVAARDLAIGIWLLIAPAVSLPAATLSLSAIAIIPLADLLLVSSHSGLTLALVPHAASFIIILVLAICGTRLA